jgi:hypothetical protein
VNRRRQDTFDEFIRNILIDEMPDGTLEPKEFVDVSDRLH